MRGGRSLIFVDVHGLPFALNDSRRGFVREFFLCGFARRNTDLRERRSAAGAMFADETVEKAFVALAAVAMAVARLLVENFFHVGREGVGILDYRIRKIVGAHGGGKRACGRLRLWNAGYIGSGLGLGK